MQTVFCHFQPSIFLFTADKSCFSNTYNNESLGECVECPSECGGSCTGPDTTVGSGGCDSCSVVELDGKGNQVN